LKEKGSSCVLHLTNIYTTVDSKKVKAILLDLFCDYYFKFDNTGERREERGERREERGERREERGERREERGERRGLL
jgi:hypothetical protein